MTKKSSAPKTVTVQTAHLAAVPWVAILAEVRALIAAAGPDLRARVDAYIAGLKLRPAIKAILTAIADSLLAAAGAPA